MPHQPHQTYKLTKAKKWNTLIYSIIYLPQNNETSPLPTYDSNKSLKFPSQYCYYIKGSFLSPRKIDDCWTREKAGYGIYNQFKKIEFAVRLPSLQNIFRAELMAIHTTLKKVNDEYSNKSAHIFIDYFKWSIHN